MADKFNYITGKAYWTKVFQLVDNYSRDGKEWTFDFTPDAEGMRVIQELGIEHKIKNKDDERGDFIQFRQREKRSSGEKNFPITVVDARNRLWDPKIDDTGKVTNPIGNGSTVEVKFKVVDYGKDKAKTARYGVYVQAIRVLDLAPYVRQEFAPLPEENEYVQKLDEEFPPVEQEEVPQEQDVLNDPLNMEE
jgi:hypothetical protein